MLGVRRHPVEESGVIGAANWTTRLLDTDLLILSVPRTGMTRALVGKPELAALAQGARVANIARGALIDEAALVAALRSGHLGGAYLDVTETEPLAGESELWSLPSAPWRYSGTSWTATSAASRCETWSISRQVIRGVPHPAHTSSDPV